MTNIVVTGGTGAIGSAAIEWCLQQYPQSNIMVLGRSSEKLAILQQKYMVQTAVLDFSLSDTDFVQQVEQCNIPFVDVLVHLAAVVPSQAQKSEDFYRVNLINARALLHNMQFREGAGILNFSSASVYDMEAIHIQESSPLTTTNDYGISKYLFEHFVEEYAQQQNIHSVSVRIPVLLAPFVRNNFIAKWRDLLLDGSKVTLFNSQSQFNSCVWIHDIFEFFQKIMLQETIHHLRCNVGAEDSISVEEAFYVLSKAYDRPALYHEIQNHRVAQYYDSSFAIAHGYKPSTVAQSLQRLAFAEKQHVGH